MSVRLPALLWMYCMLLRQTPCFGYTIQWNLPIVNLLHKLTRLQGTSRSDASVWKLSCRLRSWGDGKNQQRLAIHL